MILGMFGSSSTYTVMRKVTTLYTVLSWKSAKRE